MACLSLLSTPVAACSSSGSVRRPAFCALSLRRLARASLVEHSTRSMSETLLQTAASRAWLARASASLWRSPAWSMVLPTPLSSASVSVRASRSPSDVASALAPCSASSFMAPAAASASESSGAGGSGESTLKASATTQPSLTECSMTSCMFSASCILSCAVSSSRGLPSRRITAAWVNAALTVYTLWSSPPLMARRALQNTRTAPWRHSRIFVGSWPLLRHDMRMRPLSTTLAASSSKTTRLL
mmetsp:Transcript_19136/g.64901  ORF Transcript_19136/g.64901 Transcript_19136/m.64901 type:complete len:244 (-) Transcript_19136:525-1256(-)